MKKKKPRRLISKAASKTVRELRRSMRVRDAGDGSALVEFGRDGYRVEVEIDPHGDVVSRTFG